MKKQQIIKKLINHESQIFNKKQQDFTHQKSLQNGVTSPKFNRKQNINQIQRKSSAKNLFTDDRICFISPNRIKMMGTDTQYFSPDAHIKISHLTQNSENSNFDKSYHEDQIERGSNGWGDSVLNVLSCIQESNKKLVKENRMEQKIIMEQEIKSLKIQNKKLIEQVNQFHTIQEFLIQRQNYISNINQKVAHYHQNIKIQEQKIKELSEKILTQQMCFQQEKKDYQNLINQLNTQNQTQKLQIQIILKMNLMLKEDLKQKETGYQKSVKNNQNMIMSNIINKTLKQNNCNEATKSGKKWTRAKTSNNKVSESYEQNKKNDVDIFKKRSIDRSNSLQINLEEFEQSENYSINSTLHNSNYRIDEESLNCHECDEHIKKWKQKLRYCQIQIDILKRIKLDTKKIKEDSEKMKKMNKKLISRIQFLQQQRKRKDSDNSSLQFSLSPRK